MIRALESFMNQTVPWWLDCRESLVTRRPTRTLLHPSRVSRLVLAPVETVGCKTGS